MKLKPIRILNKDNLVMKGIVFEPDKEIEQPICIIYLPGIVLGSTAVHRLGVEIGHLLVEKGFWYLLFDQVYIGGSEETYPEGVHQKLANWIKEGNLVDDTLKAIDFFIDKTDKQAVTLIGHCGGALTAAYAGSQHKQVKGLFLISPPIVEVNSKNEIEKKEVAENYFTLYKRKILSPVAWKNLLFGKTDYKTLMHVIKGKFLKYNIVRENISDNINMLFLDSLTNMLKTKNIQIIFGDRDPELNDFLKFRKAYFQSMFPFSILKNTSHGFITKESINELNKNIINFMETVKC